MSPEDWVDEVADKIEAMRVIRGTIDDLIYAMPSSPQASCCDDCCCDDDDDAVMDNPAVFTQVLTMKADIVKQMLPILVTTIDEFLALLSKDTMPADGDE
jgi:hypothetical protein